MGSQVGYTLAYSVQQSVCGLLDLPMQNSQQLVN